MWNILSKRFYIFASEENSPEIDEFVDHANKVDNELGHLFKMRPFSEFATVVREKRAKIFSNRESFTRAMSSAVEDIVVSLRNRPSGNLRALKERMINLVGPLLIEANKLGLASGADLTLWGAKLVNAIKPGDPLKDKITELEKKR